MKKLNSFEWLLIYLIMAAFITGFFKAIDDHTQSASAQTEYYQIENLVASI